MSDLNHYMKNFQIGVIHFCYSYMKLNILIYDQCISMWLRITEATQLVADHHNGFTGLTAIF